MPKRMRDDAMKPTQPMSALAARRLLQQQQQQQSQSQSPKEPKPADPTLPKTPVTKPRKFPSVSAKTPNQKPDNGAENARAKTFPESAPSRAKKSQESPMDAAEEKKRLEFERKRLEIEAQLQARNKEVKVRKHLGIEAAILSSTDFNAIGESVDEPAKKKARKESGADGEFKNVKSVDLENGSAKKKKKKKRLFVDGETETVVKAVMETEVTEVVIRSPRPESTPTRKPQSDLKRESALERMKREKAKRQATSQDEDVEMMSPPAVESEPEVAEEIAQPQLHQVSTFVETPDTCTVEGKSAVFRMMKGETLTIVGIYQVKVLKGSVGISGCTITHSSSIQTVFAPTTHALPSIEAIKSKSNSSGDKIKSRFDVELIISSAYSSIMKISNLCPTYGNIWSLPTTPNSQFTGFSFKPVYTTTSNIGGLDIPMSWKSTIDSVIPDDTAEYDPRRILVAGSKGAGKSTLCRILTNRLFSTYKTVAYLDTDPGQPTFSPPGILSLHILTSPILSPPFITSSLPAARAHHIGYTTPRTDPAHYIACISDLLETHNIQFPDTPLIINTCGWTKGLGLELLQDILNASRATDIISLSTPPYHQNPFADLIIPEQSCTHHQLHSAAPKEGKFSAPDFRALQTMCYFHHTPIEGIWDFVNPLTGTKPWLVSYTGDQKGIDALCILGEEISSDMIPTAVDATVVGVVVVEKNAFPGTHLIEETPYPPLLSADYHPSPAVSHCRGLAVIRAVDTEKQEFQLVTSIPAEEMERWEKEGLRVILVRGRVELPVWEMVVKGREREAMGPFLELAGGQKGKGGAVWRVRRNVMRRGQQVR